METPITFTVEQIAQEIADHMRLRKEGYYGQEYYRGILFCLEMLFGREIYSQALDMAQEIALKQD